MPKINHAQAKPQSDLGRQAKALRAALAGRDVTAIGHVELMALLASAQGTNMNEALAGDARGGPGPKRAAAPRRMPDRALEIDASWPAEPGNDVISPWDILYEDVLHQALRHAARIRVECSTGTTTIERSRFHNSIGSFAVGNDHVYIAAEHPRDVPIGPSSTRHTTISTVHRVSFGRWGEMRVSEDLDTTPEAERTPHERQPGRNEAIIRQLAAADGETLRAFPKTPGDGSRNCSNWTFEQGGIDWIGDGYKDRLRNSLISWMPKGASFGRLNEMMFHASFSRLPAEAEEARDLHWEQGCGTMILSFVLSNGCIGSVVETTSDGAGSFYANRYVLTTPAGVAMASEVPPEPYGWLTKSVDETVSLNLACIAGVDGSHRNHVFQTLEQMIDAALASIGPGRTTNP